jgi:hypothetical protein
VRPVVDQVAVEQGFLKVLLLFHQINVTHSFRMLGTTYPAIWHCIPGDLNPGASYFFACDTFSNSFAVYVTVYIRKQT